MILCSCACGHKADPTQALVRPNFTKSQVADLDNCEAHIQAMIAKIPRDGSTVDLQALFFQLTLDIATDFLFGESANSLTADADSDAMRFGVAFDSAQSRASRRARLGKFSFLFRDSQYFEDCKVVHAFVDKIVGKALQKVEAEDNEKDVEKKGHEGRYVFLSELVKSTRDPIQLRDELLNVLLAGRDTTATLLSAVFHVLARRPDIFKLLKAEIDELKGMRPDYETLKGLKYLKDVLSESKPYYLC
jgi:cytochrome P450